MSGRRRYERFSVGQPWEGRLRVLRDVTVLGARGDQGLDIISSVPGVPGEVVVLELAGGGTVVSMVACVTASRPVMAGGAVVHALELLALDESRRVDVPGPGALARPATRAEVLDAADLVGVVAREADIRVLNVSASGCLVESATAVESGASATLAVRVGGEELHDAVRVTRCDRIEGAGSRYWLGAEFLWTTGPGVRSIRRATRTLERARGVGGVDAAQVGMTVPPLVM